MSALPGCWKIKIDENTFRQCQVLEFALTVGDKEVVPEHFVCFSKKYHERAQVKLKHAGLQESIGYTLSGSVTFRTESMRGEITAHWGGYYGIHSMDPDSDEDQKKEPRPKPGLKKLTR